MAVPAGAGASPTVVGWVACATQADDVAELAPVVVWPPDAVTGCCWLLFIFFLLYKSKAGEERNPKKWWWWEGCWYSNCQGVSGSGES